ncbi:uncharacterized protein EV154DRAFT_293103 [Mucor mucedo]|uniref:uncharacterized protein n=1 Tax=Mucor mucedo TaxID=29922 RepID=UPI0022203CEB|nr:uncharacterized protein EV154DRAFT_293103 [Mucor mucedo]KAI7888952.1 hypothetical protein EV154DRAFT_293103 [Mucor mucedo]
MNFSNSKLLPRLFKSFSAQKISSSLLSTTVRPTRLGFNNAATARVPVHRFVHSSPKEYNGVQSAAYHFKRQRHMPYFLEYLMWVVFGSEALHLIWLKIDIREYKEKMQHKTKLLEEIIKRVENGEVIDDSLREEIKMVLMNNKHTGEYHDDIDDEYLNSLIASSEQAAKEAPEKIKKPVTESKWVEIKEEAGNDQDKKKKQPFFL